jgi:uncharacterized protein (DUF433 family)
MTIVTDPNRFDGRPFFNTAGISVRDVLIRQWAGISDAAILMTFTDLTPADLVELTTYVKENKAAVRADILSVCGASKSATPGKVIGIGAEILPPE